MIRTQLVTGSTYKTFLSKHPELGGEPALRDKFVAYLIDKTDLGVDGLASVTMQSLEKNLETFMQGPWIQ